MHHGYHSPMAPSFETIDRLSSAFQGSQILLTAIRLELFATLASEALTADDLAKRLAADPRGIRILCDALVGFELLVKSAERYRSTESARTYLMADSPSSRVARLLHSARQYERWGHLFDVVTTGKPIPHEEGDPRLARDERSFALAMADIGRSSAGATFDRLPLEGVSRFVDVGGGPGVYAIEAARREKGLRAAVFDTAETLEVALENVRAAGLENRIDLLPGDAFEDDLRGPWDLILLSNMIHIYSADEARKLVHRCAEALAEGGRLAVKEFLLDEDHTSPAAGAIFAVNMLVSTEAGECFSVDEVGGWMRERGLVVNEAVALTAKSGLLVGARAGSNTFGVLGGDR